MISLKALAALILTFAFVAAFGQRNVSDSLEEKLQLSSREERVDILNRLTFEFISVDNDKAVRYNSEAINLAEASNYTKGAGVAYTYRGVYEYQSGQFDKARTSLFTGLSYSRKAHDRLNEGYTFLQLGNMGLEEVDTDSSYKYLRKAYDIFKDSTHAENLSKVYRNLSALFGQRLQPDSQQYFLQKAIAIRRLLPDKSYLVDALAIQATNKLSTGNIAEAEELVDEAELILSNYPHDLENLNDVKHVRALILFQEGKFENAMVLFDSARNYYLRTSLFRKYVTLLTDLGEIFSDRGEYELALNNLYDALRLSILKRFETESYIIRTKIGSINLQLGDYAQADRVVDETLTSHPKKLLKADLANALTLKGLVSTQLRHFKEARTAFDSVLSLHAHARNKQGISDDYRNLATVESRLGNTARALSLYKKSIAVADSSGYIYGLGWSKWGMADIYYRQKKYEEASQYLDESEKYARMTQANELLILSYETRRDILRATGKFGEALQFSMMAGQMKDSLRRSDVVRRFANLEKIQEIERRDRDIKVLQHEKRIAEDMISVQESRLRQLYISVIASVVIIALLIFIYFRIKKLNVTITEKNNNIEAQAIKLSEVNQELNRLYNEVSEKNQEIEAQARELSVINKSVTDANRNLEQVVAEKTVELQKTNEELVKQNNELLQFSYTVSHNLRGSVARLLGLASLMNYEEDPQQTLELVNLIGKTAGELDVIIKDLSKLLELRREPRHFRDHVDLSAEWQQCVRLLHDSLNGTEEITADFHALPELVTVRAMVQNAFYNLISNALKFRSQERPLRIHASSDIDGDKAIITVTDNGLGLDVNLYKDKLFRLYTRFHSHVEGRGLGLYLVKSQLQVVGGSISVSSTPGAGAIFQLVIPLSPNGVH